MSARRRMALAAAALLVPLIPAHAKPPPNPIVPRITVTQKAPAKTAEFAQIEITWENMSGSGISRIDFGDGSPGLVTYAFDFGCRAIDPLYTNTEVIPHAYRRAGSWTVTVTFEPECPDSVYLPPYKGEGTITVTQGRSPSNGPEQPHFWNGLQVGDVVLDKPDRRKQAMADYEDYDGYLTRIAYRWGDGSPDRVFTFPLTDCHDPRDHWPLAVASEDDPWWGLVHRYKKPGTYTATVTMTTTGCNGRDRQTASSTAKVVVR